MSGGQVQLVHKWRMADQRLPWEAMGVRAGGTQRELVTWARTPPAPCVSACRAAVNGCDVSGEEGHVYM